jgi:predicted Zn-dependent peptidase
VARLFGAWTGRTTGPLARRARERRRRHLAQETAQTQIGLAFPSVPYGDPAFYAARGVVGVLSGGMSGRLFVEIREKRGLAYAVAAQYHSLKGLGSILCYAGTTPDRAQETLDVLVEELRRVCEGITEEEVERTKAGLLSSLVMEGESTLARASAIAGDWYMLGEVVPLATVRERIVALTPRALLAYLEAHPPASFTMVTLGPGTLALPEDGP